MNWLVGLVKHTFSNLFDFLRVCRKICKSKSSRSITRLGATSQEYPTSQEVMTVALLNNMISLHSFSGLIFFNCVSLNDTDDATS